MSARFPALTLITFLPALAGLGLALVKRDREELVKVISLVATLVVLGLSLFVFLGFDADAVKGGAPALQFDEDHAWVTPLHIRYHLGIDGIALAMVLLTAILSPLAVLCSWHSIHERARGFFISLLFLETGMMGVFCAADLFLFYVFWEAMLLPMYLIIGVWGGPRRVYAAVKFILYTLVGSLLMLVAILYCYSVSGREGTFDIVTLQSRLPISLTGTAQTWLFLAFALSFAIKVPMFPFHTWLPDAHVEAPTAGSVILAGVLLKMGAYGFLRFAIPLFPDAAATFAPMMIVLSVIGILYGSAMSMAQNDIKKLVAYSSVAHLGFVMLGIFSGNVAAAQGGVLQMVNHGISTGALFLLVGVIYERTHRRGVDDFGGLAKVMPAYATIFMIVTLSSIGLPGTNGFVGEWLVLAGTFQTHPVAAGFAGLGVILGAMYMLKLYRDIFFGKVTMPKYASLPDVNRLELSTLLPLVVLVFAVGILPNFLLSRTELPVRHALHRLEQSRAGISGVADAR